MFSRSRTATRPGFSEAALLVIIIFFFSLQEAMLVPAFPAILKAFAVSPAQAGWLTSASLFGVSLVVPMLGRLSDLFDKGWIVLYTSFAALFGSVICLSADSFPVLLLGQVLIGLSYALHPLGVGLMSELLPAERAPTGIGFVIGASVAGTTIGLVASGPVVAAFGIRGIYGAPFALLLGLVLMLSVLQRRERKPLRKVAGAVVIDWLGALLLGATTVLMMLGLGSGSQQGWGAGQTLLYLGAAAAMLAAFIVTERRHRAPMLELGLFRARGLSVVCLIAIACGVGAIAPGMLVPLIVQADPRSGIGLGLDVTATGWYMLPFGIAACASAPLGGALRRWLDNRRCLLLSAMMMCAGNLSLFIWHDTVTMLVVGVALTGAGVGLASAETMNTVVAIVSADRVGSASSMVYVVKGMAGMAISQICAGFLGAATDPVTHLTSASGYTLSFIVCVAICAVGVLACLFFRADAPRVSTMPASL